ncbi:MAG: hypothetical protein GY898_14805 [Proteobacteria bacterium]|nr:hypothetical protein [Pseudomonadota bacterium]
MSRDRTDRVLASLADVATWVVRLPGARALLVGLVSVLATVSWPFLDVRRRARSEGVTLRPWSWGAQLGRTLAALVGSHAPIEVVGWDQLPRDGRGVVVLSAHLGPWEAGAAELAARGLRPAVIAAPWPRLPRTERRIASLRADHGVASIPRGTAGWREATRHLRRGGSVVVLIDSASGERKGRRAVDFVDGCIGAPDAVVAWAKRQGADVWTAVGSQEGFEMHGSSSALIEGDEAEIRRISDRTVELLRHGVRARPAQWAWVKALAMLTFVVVVGVGCGGGDTLPPVPDGPEGWEVVADQPRWDGFLDNGTRAKFVARRAVVEWKDKTPHGRFEGIDVHFMSADGETVLGRVWASKANGTWPDGPLTMNMVGWALETPKDAGSLDTVTYTANGAWSCGGCALEAFLK